MRQTSLVLSSLIALGFTACQSTTAAPCADTQKVVDSVAAANPDVIRLTVHAVPPAGGEYCAIASTSADKRGKPSDPEDFDAMQTGQTVVRDEPGAIDVTVPVLQKAGKWTAAVGVTLKAESGDSRSQLTARGQQIAQAVAAQMPTRM